MKQLAFILSFNVMITLFYPLLAQSEDSLEYDLYDRMRSGKVFSENNYPNPQKIGTETEEICPGCGIYRRYEPSYPNRSYRYRR